MVIGEDEQDVQFWLGGIERCEWRKQQGGEEC